MTEINPEEMDVNSTLHIYFMRKAIKVAKKNMAVPYGAILVFSDKEIVASAYNSSKTNPILHAELSVIHEFFTNNKKDINRISLYTTAEPCSMCMSAIYWARISRVIFGSNIPFLQSLFNTQINLRASEVLKKTPDFYKCELVDGVLEHECNQLFIASKNNVTIQHRLL